MASTPSGYSRRNFTKIIKYEFAIRKLRFIFKSHGGAGYFTIYRRVALYDCCLPENVHHKSQQFRDRYDRVLSFDAFDRSAGDVGNRNYRQGGPLGRGKITKCELFQRSRAILSRVFAADGAETQMTVNTSGYHFSARERKRFGRTFVQQASRVTMYRLQMRFTIEFNGVRLT